MLLVGFGALAPTVDLLFNSFPSTAFQLSFGFTLRLLIRSVYNSSLLCRFVVHDADENPGSFETMAFPNEPLPLNKSRNFSPDPLFR